MARDARAQGTHNLLVISDLHLGDSLRPSEPGYLKGLAALNRALCRFLKHYARQRVNGRPWRLVIAGDMIDFLHAGLFGGADGGGEAPPNTAVSEPAAVAWLEEVMVRERRVFRLLASFVGAGHELVIIKGNHDAQFHFEAVQTRFVELLGELYLRRAELRRRLGEEERRARAADFTRRISFCRWFYYEPELVYIEHGNQYDAFCSFEHVLSPIYPDHFELEDPISHTTYRAFARLIGHLDVHQIDRWRLLDYARWLLGLGPRVIGQLALTYFASVSWMLRTKRRLVAAARKARAEHLARRSSLVSSFGLSEEVLHALDELRERPAGNSVLSGIRMLYMDRVLLLVLNLMVLLGVVVAPGALVLRAGLASAFVAMSVAAHFLLERSRRVDPTPKLRRVALQIARLMKVPFVVFGHSHVPVMAEAQADRLEAAGAAEAARPEAWYLNTGSWTAESEQGLTHVCILVEPGAPRARLLRWCPSSQRPEPMLEGEPGLARA